MIKHIARIGFAPLRIILLLILLPLVILDFLADALLNAPLVLFRPASYSFAVKGFWAAMAGHFVPKP